jgi:hypothetical protein
MQNHPYADLESTRVWVVLEKALGDLIENNDLRLTTAPEYVIGYICKQMREADLITESGFESITE